MPSPDEPQFPPGIAVPRPGVLTRSTVGTEPVDAREEAIDDALHWVWSWRVQAKRLVESFTGEWHNAPPLDRRRAFSRCSFDEHILVVTGWNLARALRRAQSFVPGLELQEGRHEALKLLRHLYEHWDEQRDAFRSPDAPKRRSAAALAEQFPNGRPWTLVLDEKDWLLGGLVAINDLTKALSSVEELLLAKLGTDAPNGAA